MTVQLVAEHPTAFHGLRPLDPRRDLSQVADLIEEAFAGELEPGGLAALRDMRMLSRMGPLVGLVSRTDPTVEDVLGGFVWIDQQRVVGNVTLQRLDAYGSRWQIANVAVAKSHQGRGIGRALMLAALERISDRRGTWAVLQVRANNTVAFKLYQSLGFEVITRETRLRLEQVPSESVAETSIDLRPYHHHQWQRRYELEAAARTALDQWWRPVRSQQFYEPFESRLGERLWELAGRNRKRSWVVAGNQGLMAWLSVNARRWQGSHAIDVTVHPACRGQLERALVAHALRYLVDYPRWPVTVEHFGEHPELLEALQGVGFSVVRNHFTMRKKLD